MGFIAESVGKRFPVVAAVVARGRVMGTDDSRMSFFALRGMRRRQDRRDRTQIDRLEARRG